MIINISEIRRRNLIAVGLKPQELAVQCGGQSKSWANVLSTTGKSFGEKKARRIEACLNLEVGALDRPVLGIDTVTLATIQKRAKRNKGLGIERNTAQGILTEKQFKALASLVSTNEPNRTAAEMVLVEGWKIADAARVLEANEDVLGKYVRRLQEANLMVMRAYDVPGHARLHTQGAKNVS